LFPSKTKELLIFSLPIIAGQVGQTLFSIGDIIVAGHYSKEMASALGIASMILVPFIMFGLGLTFAIGPIISKKRGAKESTEGILWTSICSSFLISVIVIISLFIFIYFIDYINFPANIGAQIKSYLIITSPSVLFALVFQAYKEYLQSFHDTLFANITILIFNIINVLLNIMLVFGVGIIPELGIIGAAYATLISRLLMAVVLAIYTHLKHTEKNTFNIKIFKDIFTIGIPISTATLLEVLAFTTVTVIVGKMGIITSAAHNIVLNFSSMTFMVPLGLASAVSVKIAHSLGENNYSELHEYTKASLFISVSFMTITAFIYSFFPAYVMKLGTSDQQVINYGVGLLFYVALFQIPDGLQVTLWGVLRGMQTTKWPMILGFIANWVISLPLGIYLAFKLNMEAAGLWAGLALGLSLMSVGLSIIYYRKLKNLKELIH
tara:strand:- start:81543 stop:82850 length:1308 start_codon:yes stop_codon:yes gene_type:complete